MNELDVLLADLLFVQLQQAGLISNARSCGEPEALARLSESYGRWWIESVRILVQHGYLAPIGAEFSATNQAPQNAEAVWDEWAKLKKRQELDPQTCGQVGLLDACLRSLPNILFGSIKATEVLFPNSSFHLMEGVYKNNHTADHFNGCVARVVSAYCHARMQGGADEKLRVLEIGAGTGAATEVVLGELQKHSFHIEQYLFTDLSNAFLLNAEDRFGPTVSFFRTAILDVEAPFSAQDIDVGTYDIVIASNVLHATHDIRRALRNGKAALKKHGLLVLNEIAGNSLFAHLTFGLLEGWWLYRDSNLRIRGCPGLRGETWRHVLQLEGFRDISFPVFSQGHKSQQIIVAHSDGIFRQPYESEGVQWLSADQRRDLIGATSHDNAQPAVSIDRASRPQGSREQEVAKKVRYCVSKTLRLPQDRIEDNASFSEFGVDSIIAVKLIKEINCCFGLDLPTTTIFDYPCVAKLVAHIDSEGNTVVSLGDRSTREYTVKHARSDDVTSNIVQPADHSSDQFRDIGPTGVEHASSGRTSYWRVEIAAPGSIEDIRIVQAILSPLQRTEVRVAVRAFSINFGDLLCVTGLYPSMPPYPFTPGFEVSGVIIETGAAVRSLKVGQAVVALMGEKLGGHATIASCHQDNVFLKPAKLSFEEACSLPSVALTVLEAFDRAGLAKGDKILIHNAAGGVGLIAVQLAIKREAIVFGAAGSEEKIEFLRKQGVVHLIDYRKVDFQQEVERLTLGSGVDVVLNTLAGEARIKGLRCLAARGRYIELAMTSLKASPAIDGSSLNNNQTFYSVDLRKLGLSNPELILRHRDNLIRLVEGGDIHATISSIIPFEKIRDAFAKISSRENIGKIVVSIPESYQTSWFRSETEIDYKGAPSADCSSEPIAIVGMSGRFASADSVEELWSYLAQGSELVADVTRWELDDTQKCCVSLRAGLLNSIDNFDPSFFSISGVEATFMDPQQRLLLQEAWAALEDAGYAGAQIRGTSCGTYIGCSNGDYVDLIKDAPPQAFWGNASSLIPARIAYCLDLHGPAIAVDTACSSSLVAIHLACQGLWMREIQTALAGGVFVQCTPRFHQAAAKAKMLSQSGRCYVFDDRADGFVSGEAVGVLVLRRLSDALANRDHVYGIIRGSGINQDGATNGITAPSAVSQESLERHVYDVCGIGPDAISMVEAHGTGTSLGDPIEHRALTSAFRHSTTKSQFCAIGSIKSNIGHTATAAGVASVIKVLLSLQHRKIPASINFACVNANIKMLDSPFYVNKSLEEWNVAGGARRCAAVSSFGFGGTNAHIVIEEYCEGLGEGLRPIQISQAHPALVVLSAKNEERLQERARQLLAHIRAHGCTDAELGDIAYTLQVGREAMGFRIGIIATTMGELEGKLLGYVERQAEGEEGGEYYLGEVKKNREALSIFDKDEAFQQTIQTWIRRSEYAKLLELWVKGLVFDWRKLYGKGSAYGDNLPRRVSLPTYPFARERYWVKPLVLDTSSDVDRMEEFHQEKRVGLESRESGSAEVPSDKTEQLMFAEAWEERPLDSSTGLSSRATVVVVLLSNAQGQADVATAVTQCDAQTHLIFISQSMTDAESDSDSLLSNTYRVMRSEADSYNQVFSRITREHGQIDSVWYLWSLEDASCIKDQAPIVHLIQGLSRAGVNDVRIILAGEYRSALERCYVESWIGYGRSLRGILPGVRMEVIQAQGAESGGDENVTEVSRSMEAWGPRLWKEFRAEKMESALYIRDIRHILRIKPIEMRGESVPMAVHPGGTYLITGGLGGLGNVLAMHLAKQYCAKLILTGRSALNKDIEAKLKALEDLGGQAIYIIADVSNLEQMRMAIAQGQERMGELCGVIHAAGIESTVSLLTKDMRSVEVVLAPKVTGTLVLDELLKEHKLEFICYFSSSSVSLGDFGSCDYAVGNRFELAHAKYVSSRAIAICWPMWADGHMGSQDIDAMHLYLKASGQRALGAAEGIAILENLLARRQADQLSHSLIMVGNRTRVYQILGLMPPARPLSGQFTREQREVHRADLRGLTIAQCVVWELKELASDLLKTPREKLDAEENLADFGFDSIGLAAFAQRLSTHMSIKVLPSVFFSHTTLRKVADYLIGEFAETVQRLYGDFEGSQARGRSPGARVKIVGEEVSRLQMNGSSAHSVAASQSPTLTDVPESIAVIGMSGRFPKARTVDELWQILTEGKTAIEEIPVERFDWQNYYQAPSEKQGVSSTMAGKMTCKWLGMVPGVDEFDPLFFEISPKEAELMDPRQRLLLQESFKALEDAGYGAAQLEHHKIGMFVGVEQGDYQVLVGGEGNLTGNHDAILASRLSYFLNLRGPTMAINTACSSGLVAVHQACLSLRAGECDTAMAASVSLTLTPQMYIGMSQAGMLSSDGTCYAFDRRANGLVPGEAAVTVVLKCLSQAEADGDLIYALIRGSGINYDGKTNGMTAPSGVAQTELIKEVYQRAQVTPGEIEYIVTHGTGTRLGDPVEINALRDAFKDTRQGEPHCALTSTKTNVGHTFAASGLVSLVSLVQALRHETIPASLQCEQLSDYIDWTDSPFYVNRQNKAWPRKKEGSRLGAISAFGMSGTNAHVLMESYEKVHPSISSPIAAPYYLLALSAKTEAALQQRAHQLLNVLNQEQYNGNYAPLTALSHTLLAHRQHFAFRYALVIEDREQAIRVLEKMSSAEKQPALVKGKVARDFAAQPMLLQYAEDLLRNLCTLYDDPGKYQQSLAALADLYCQGYPINWQTMYGELPPQRLSLPTYPFAQDRYWKSREDYRPAGMHNAQLATNKRILGNDPPSSIEIRPQVNDSESTDERQKSIFESAAQGPDIESAQTVERGLEFELSQTLGLALYIDDVNLDRETLFVELGLDSIIGIEWVRAINEKYKISISATTIYEYATIRRLSQFLATKITADISDFPQTRCPTHKKLPESPSLPANSDQITRPPTVILSAINQPGSHWLVPKSGAAPIWDPSSRSELIETELCASLASALCVDSEYVDPLVPFRELGLDSIIGVEWVRVINDQYGMTLAAARLYDHPTARLLAQFLVEQLDNSESYGQFEDPSAAPTYRPSLSIQLSRFHQVDSDLSHDRADRPKIDDLTSGHRESMAPGVPTRGQRELCNENDVGKIAIVGVSGAFPKATGLSEYWTNLSQGRDCVSEIPLDRWSIAEHYNSNPNAPGKTYCKWMAYLEEMDQFDPLFFNISPADAELMDPQQRLFLEHCWSCIEEAAISPVALSGTRCGVYVGCAASDYGHAHAGNVKGLTAQGLMGTSSSILSARIAYCLNLKGPCLAIDTACSSSLVAIAQACDGLVLSRSDLALAGGVAVISGPSLHIMTSNAGMLSKEGRCFTFDSRADGFVPGEAVGVVLLKRMEDAIRDKDHIHGIIRGWGVNQDGKTNGITAPSASAQTRLQKQVYDQFQIDPDSISMLEAHGTGTRLGDPIEVEALTNAFRDYTKRQHFCALGSVKSNIGHTLAAAGISGVIKVLLALRNQMLPPTVNFSSLNEHISLEGSPFYINTSLRSWDASPAMPRRAAINSFGFSGTNAHLVIDEYQPALDTSTSIQTLNGARTSLFVLSAKTAEQLFSYVERMTDCIEADSTLTLEQITFTLQVGREEMEHRLAVVCNSTSELLAGLRSFLEKRPTAAVLTSHVKRSQEGSVSFEADPDAKDLLLLWARKNKVRQLANLWLNGGRIDWHLLYSDDAGRPSRISLPTYPFARERYWLPRITESPQNTVHGLTAQHLTPKQLATVHQGLSSSTTTQFTQTFTGRELCLHDHVINGQRVMPAAVYLEIVRTALSTSFGGTRDLRSTERRDNFASMYLQHVTWLRPMILGGLPPTVHVVLKSEEEGVIDFEIRSEMKAPQSSRDDLRLARSVAEGETTLLLHSQGRIVRSRFATANTLDLAELESNCVGDALTGEQCYSEFQRMGFEYGPSFRAISALRVGRHQTGDPFVLAQVCMPDCITSTEDQYTLHPSLLDGAFQCCIGFAMNGNQRSLPLPFAIDQFEYFRALPIRMNVYIRENPDSRAELIKLDINICDDSGRICARAIGLTSRPVAAPRATIKPVAGPIATLTPEVNTPIGVLLLRQHWERKPADLSNLPNATNTIRNTSAVPLFRHEVLLNAATFKRVGSDLLLHLPSLVIGIVDSLEGDLAEAFCLYAGQVFERVQAILGERAVGRTLLQVVLTADHNAELYFAISGLFKTANQENPRFGGQIIQVDAHESLETLVEKLLENAERIDDQEVQYREGHRWVEGTRSIAPA
jgi:acyl transferase domain-containing protein/NADPH:quinone reductase-like Zn-dependent oxidoreductase/acyl carrier protein/SAM-dependent methyltransferase